MDKIIIGLILFSTLVGIKLMNTYSNWWCLSGLYIYKSNRKRTYQISVIEIDLFQMLLLFKWIVIFIFIFCVLQYNTK